MRALKCQVFTKKGGLLSRLAHDLTLDVTRWEVSINPQSQKVEARFEPSSLRVQAPAQLSASDRRQIEETIRTQILKKQDSPILWRSVDAIPSPTHLSQWLSAPGVLTLEGQDSPVDVQFRRTPFGFEVKASFEPSRFGIAPFSAMMGALKVADEVRIEAEIQT